MWRVEAVVLTIVTRWLSAICSFGKSSAADELRPRLLAFPFCACHADVGRHAGGFSKACGSASQLPSPSHYVAPGGGLAQRQIRSAPTVSVPLVLLSASTNSLFDGIGFVPVCE